MALTNGAVPAHKMLKHHLGEIRDMVECELVRRLGRSVPFLVIAETGMAIEPLAFSAKNLTPNGVIGKMFMQRNIMEADEIAKTGES
jgi:hypothetical protein